jgi:hypothetical protein
MDAKRIKAYLLELADKVDSKTTLEDIYNHLALLRDIDQAEEEVKLGLVVPDSEVRKMAREWLK